MNATNVEVATKHIITETDDVGKIIKSVLSEATEMGGIAKKLQNGLQKMIEKRM